MARFMYRDIANAQDSIVGGGGGGRASGRRGGGGDGGLVGLMAYMGAPSRSQQQQDASLAELAEAFGPEFAAEEGITEEEARRSITEGVASPESPGRKIVRSIFGGEAPAGEAYDMRMGKVRGRLVRGQVARQRRAAGREDIGQLTELLKYTNPDDLEPAMQKAMANAGYDLGDMPIELQRPPASSVTELAERGGPGWARYNALMTSRGGRGGGRAPTSFEQFIAAYTSKDPQMVEAAKAWKSRVDRGDDPHRAWLELLAGTGINAMQANAENTAYMEWELGGRQGPRPFTPLKDTFFATAYSLGAGGMGDGGWGNQQPGDEIGDALRELFDAEQDPFAFHLQDPNSDAVPAVDLEGWEPTLPGASSTTRTPAARTTPSTTTPTRPPVLKLPKPDGTPPSTFQRPYR